MKKELYNYLFNWKFILGIMISIIFSFFAFKNFNINTLLLLLDKINYSIITLAIILLLFSVYIRALRWKLLFKTNNISIRTLFDAEMIGYFGNNIFPLRFGELLRCIIISKKYNLTKSYIFGTVVLERFLDMFGIIIVCILLFSVDSSILINCIIDYNLYYIFIVVPFILIISLLLTKIKKYNIENKIVLLIRDIIEGFSGLNTKNIIFVIFYTIIIWIIYILEVYLIQLSISLDLNIAECMFLLVISSIALSIPSSPANIGTFELAIVGGMSILGVPLYSSEFSVLLHSLTFFPYTIFGGLLFLYNNYLIYHNK